jgi:acyl carrier protein
MADAQISGAGYQPETVVDLLDFLDKIPENKYGTVARYALEGADTGEDVGPVTIEGLLTHIAEVLGGAATDYDPSKPLEVFGLDSLSLTEIFSWVNRRCSKPMKAAGTATVQVIMAHIEKHAKAK